MFGKVVIDTSTNKLAKSDKINREIRRVFWLTFRFCWSSRGTCAQLTTAFSYKSQPTQIWMPWVLGGKALPKNGKTTARMGLYFLALEQRKGTELELLRNQSVICGSSGGLRLGTHNIHVDHLYSRMFISLLGCKSF